MTVEFVLFRSKKGKKEKHQYLPWAFIKQYLSLLDNYYAAEAMEKVKLK